MRQGEIYAQVDGGTRCTYECPRGTVAIDEFPDGTREITKCLGGSGLTARDLREARALHESVIADEREEERNGY